MKNSLVGKPEGLNKGREWLRVKDIIDMYPIGKSTVWDWAEKEKLTPIKVSPRVTVFSAKEVENLFKYDSRKFEEVKVGGKKIRRRHKVKTFKSQAPKTIKKSEQTDREMIEDYIKKHVKPNVEFEEYDYDKIPQRRRRKKLPPAKEGVMGTQRDIRTEMKNKMKNKRNTNV